VFRSDSAHASALVHSAKVIDICYEFIGVRSHSVHLLSCGVPSGKSTLGTVALLSFHDSSYTIIKTKGHFELQQWLEVTGKLRMHDFESRSLDSDEIVYRSVLSGFGRVLVLSLCSYRCILAKSQGRSVTPVSYDRVCHIPTNIDCPS
jgi:hypothetical protein